MHEDLHTFSWDKELETGIDLIDSQHKEFIKRANKFIIQVMFRKLKQGIEEEYEFMNDYLLYHFQVEETYMFDSNYPDYKGHQAEHLKIKFQLLRIGTVIKNSEDSQELQEEFLSFVKEWVINHIMVSDIKFSKYYNQQYRTGDV